MIASLRARHFGAGAMLAAALWFSPHASAFESSEHCSLSNFASALAFDWAISHAPNPEQRDELIGYRKTFAEHAPECFPKHWFRPGNIDFSYGKITALVDSQNTLDDVFLRYGGVTQGAESPQDLSETYFGDRAWLLGRFTLAGHNNISHFQGLLMASFARWHESAVIAARADGNLFQALAAHAIADHFLQDFFAPGHIVTPRDNLPDVVALSWHDRYNNAGLPMIVQNWSELQPLAEFAIERAGQADSNLDFLFAAIGPHERKLEPSQVKGAIARARTALENASDEFCPSDEKHDFGASPRLLDAINRQQQLGSGDRRIALCVYGDGSLGSTQPAVAHRAAAQALLMALVQARYILDVIDEYQGKRVARTYAEYVFCPQMTSRAFKRADADNRADVAASPAASDVRPRLTCPEQMRLAEHALVDEQPPENFQSCFDDDDCTPIYAAPVAVTRYAAYAIDAAPTQRFILFDPVVALSASFKSGSSDASNGVWGIETLPLGIVGARDYIRDREFRDLGVPNVGLALGYEGPISNSGALDHAYTARVVWALPRLDMLLSAYGKRMYLEDQFRDHQGWGYGLRFETGFSLLTAYLSFGREPVLERGIADRDEIFGAGVTFSISSRRALRAVGSWFD